MTKTDKKLLKKIEKLKFFCYTHGYPLAELLELEEEYYKVELTTKQ